MNDISCTWILMENSDNVYKSECGHILQIGGKNSPQENGMIYCPFCANILIKPKTPNNIIKEEKQKGEYL